MNVEATTGPAVEPGDATARSPLQPGRRRVAYVVRSWPRLSQTFILDEVRGIERLGGDLMLCALTDPREDVVQPEVAEVRADVRYLDHRASGAHGAAARRAPLRYLRAVGDVAQARSWDRAYHEASRWRCLTMALQLVTILEAEAARGAPVAALHAHFAHDPAAIALLTHRLTGLPWTFTAHARDLLQVGPADLVTRVQSAGAVVTCCAENVRYLDQVLPPHLLRRVHLIPHGVDVATFAPAPRNRLNDGEPTIASVGRLVEKKGFGDLLAACGRLHDEGRRFRLVILGDGPLQGDLERASAALGLTSCVTFAGAQPRDEVRATLQAADVFALTPYVADDGDRDGIPNVVLEAMACGLPVVTTSAGGVTEAVDGTNGLVAEPRDVTAIAAHLADLLDDGDRRAELGRAARHTVEERFDSRKAVAELASLLGVA